MQKYTIFFCHPEKSWNLRVCQAKREYTFCRLLLSLMAFETQSQLQSWQPWTQMLSHLPRVSRIQTYISAYVFALNALWFLKKRVKDQGQNIYTLCPAQPNLLFQEIWCEERCGYSYLPNFQGVRHLWPGQVENVRPATNVKPLGTSSHPIDAILVFSDSSNWYLDLQLMTDLITSGESQASEDWER